MAITDEEIDILYENNMLGVSSGESVEYCLTEQHFLECVVVKSTGICAGGM